MIRVYISPSMQEANIGVGNYGSEEKRMNEIADVLIPILQRHGISCFRNRPTMNHIAAKDESNKLGVDAHIAIHSNAGGGKGASVFTSGTIKGRKLAHAIYDEISKITPADPDRGVKTTTDLTEVVKTNAPATLIEVSFHDHREDAAWILTNISAIALAIAKGILKYFNMPYIRPAIDFTPAPIESPFNLPPQGYEWRLIKKEL